MLGMSRTVKGDAMVAFEYLRIVERAEGVFYVAHPNARTPGTDFRLTSLTTTRVVFENPQHDFPKRIIYEKKGEQGLSAVVDAGDGTHAETYDYRTDTLNSPGSVAVSDNSPRLKASRQERVRG